MNGGKFSDSVIDENNGSDCRWPKETGQINSSFDPFTSQHQITRTTLYLVKIHREEGGGWKINFFRVFLDNVSDHYKRSIFLTVR